MWAAQASLVPQQLGAEGQRAKGETWGPLLSSAHLKEKRSLRLSKEELKFLGGRTSRGPAVVGEKNGAQVWLRWTWRAVLTTFPVHGQEKSKGRGIAGLPAQVN